MLLDLCPCFQILTSKDANHLQRVHRSEYTKLPALRDHIESVNDQGGDISSLQQFLHLPDNQNQCRDILWTLTTHSKNLSSSEDNLPSWWSQEKLHQSSPAYEVRECAITLYHTLSEKWPGCGKATHEARLCITRYQAFEKTAAQVDFDLFFSTHNPKWQESRVGVFLEEYN